MRGFGELKGSADNPHWVELALSIERPYQGRGIGRALFERLVLKARNRGFAQATLHCSRNNQLSRQLARSYGASLSLQAGEVEGYVALPWPSPYSLVQEVTAESAALLGWYAWRLESTSRGGLPTNVCAEV